MSRHRFCGRRGCSTSSNVAVNYRRTERPALIVFTPARRHSPQTSPQAVQSTGGRRRWWGRISSCGQFSIGPRSDAYHKGLWRQRLSRRGPPLLAAPPVFAFPTQRPEDPGATNLLPCPIGGSWILVAHALLRAVSALLPTLNISPSRGVGRSADAVRRSACATSAPVFPTVCKEPCGECGSGTQECVGHFRPAVLSIASG